VIRVTHPFECEIPDGDDNGWVRPSDWNDEHAITGQLQFVGHRGWLPGTFTQGGGSDNYTLGEARYFSKMGNARCSDLRLLFSGFYVQSSGAGEIANPYDLAVRASIETPNPPLINHRLHYSQHPFNLCQLH